MNGDCNLTVPVNQLDVSSWGTDLDWNDVSDVSPSEGEYTGSPDSSPPPPGGQLN